MIKPFQMTVGILGTPYTVRCTSASQEPRLHRCDGFCDKSSHLICVKNWAEDSDLDDPTVYVRHCFRHEVAHAFFFESGLHENWEHQPAGQEELVVDWIAAQFHKMYSVICKIENRISKETV